MYMTQQYRPIEFGVFTVGSYYNWAGIMIPPNSESFQNDYSCRTSCLDVSSVACYTFSDIFIDFYLFKMKKLYSNAVTDPYVQNEITVFGSIAHTHYHGIKTSARIVRDGKEIDYMNHNNYYTGRKQNYAFMKPVTLKKVK